MSSTESAQSIKILTETHIESDKAQSAAAPNEISSEAETTVGDDKAGNKTFAVNIFLLLLIHITQFAH